MTTAALPGGSPLDPDRVVAPSEIPVTTYVSSCSPIDAGFEGYCQEELLDLNADGIADLVMGIGVSTPATNKYYQGREDSDNPGFGSGLFQAANFFGPQTPTGDIKFADLDGDGDLDMVEANRNSVNYIYENDGSDNGIDSLGPAQAIDGRTDRSASVSVGDVNGDGALDLVFANESSQSNLVYLNANDGSLSFGPAILLDSAGNEAWTRRVALIDADNDNDLDIVATSATGQGDAQGTGNRIYINQGGGTFAAAADLTPGFADDDTDVANSIAVGDIDGDNDLDLVFSVWRAPNRYYLNDGSGNFTPGGTFGGSGTGGQTSHVRLGDLDNDGDLDAAVTTTGADNLIYLNTLGGSGIGFAAGIVLPDPTIDPSGNGFDESRHLGLTDLNGDGYLDIIIANRGPAVGPYQLDTRYLNNRQCNVPLNGDAPACFPFENQGQTINSQTTDPINIPPNLPYDVLDAMEHLDVVDIDNVYPSDHRVRILPAGGPNWTCEVPGGSECGSTVIIPDDGYEGPLTVSMRTTDGFNTSQPWNLKLMVSAVGVSPTFESTPVIQASEGLPYTYNIETQDLDGDTLEIDTPPSAPLPGWLDLIDNGNRTATLSGTPTADDLGDHDVTIRVRDGNGNSATQPFTITVTAGAPIFSSTPVTAATENSAYTYSIEATDPNGDNITIAYDASSDMPAWLTLSDGGDGTATLTGTPAGADIGTSDIVLIVTDTNMQSTTQAFALTVAAAADAPVITLLGDNPLILEVGDTFTDPGFTASDAQDGDLTDEVSVTGTVDTSTEDDYTLTYTVQDSAGNQAQAQRVVTVEAAGSGGGNTDPVLTSPGAQTARVGQSYSLNIASNATDADGDTLTFSATGLPSSLTLSASGTLSGTPVSVDTANSPYTVNVTVDDGNGGTDSATFTLTISPAVSGGGGSSGGGGAFGLLDLLLLLGGTAAAGLRRRLGFGRA